MSEGKDRTAASRGVEETVFRMLERPPEIAVPQDFAGRVARAAAEQRLRRRSIWSGFGMRAALGAGALLTAALFAFAPHAVPSLGDLRFDVEMLALVELGGVAYLVARLGSQES